MNILVAADRHWAIGKDGRGLVTIPADQQMLMRETAGKVVVMGRKTLEGLPGAQPLGNRVNVVLSGNRDYKVKGARVGGSLDETRLRVEPVGPDERSGFGFAVEGEYGSARLRVEQSGAVYGPALAAWSALALLKRLVSPITF